jgi:hypothetical protein
VTGTVTRPSSVPHRRPYTDADLPMLQRTVAGWIASAGRCGYDHIGELPHRIYENLRGRRPVGELIHVWADDAGATAGLPSRSDSARRSTCSPRPSGGAPTVSGRRSPTPPRHQTFGYRRRR